MQGLAELLVGHLGAAGADDLKAGAHAAFATQVVERGNQFAAGEVSTGPEDHQGTGIGVGQSGTLQLLFDFGFDDWTHRLLRGISDWCEHDSECRPR